MEFPSYKLIKQQVGGPQWTCEFSEPGPYRCKYCAFQADLKVILTDHFRIRHLQKRIDPHELECYKCEGCDYKTYSVILILNHIYNLNHVTLPQVCAKYVIRKGPKAFTCGECSHTTDELSLKIHILLKHTPSEAINWFQCEQCSYKCNQKARLKSHKLSKHTEKKDTRYKKDTKWYKCDECSFTSKWKNGLRVHLVSHKPSEWLHCDQCDYQAKHKPLLQAHVLGKHGDPDDVRWFRCGKCEYKTVQKHCLKTHNLLKHLSPKEVEWFKCEHCHFKSKLKGGLARHTLVKHTDLKDIRWFRCERCSFKTKIKCYLRKHIQRSHMESKKRKWFKCEHCFYKGRRKDHLKRHISSQHATESEDFE